MRNTPGCWPATLLFLLAMGSPARGQEPPRVWRLCVSDANVPPYLYNDPNRPGLWERIVMAAGQEVGWTTVIVRYPTARCRKMLAEGTLDAELFAATPQNLADYVFPMKDGAVDASRRIGSMSIVWVKRPDTPYEWTESGMAGATPGETLVGTRASVRSAIEPVQRLGFKVDATASTSTQLLFKLEKGRVDLVAGLQEEIELSMQDPRLKDLVILPRPLSSAVFYGVVRKDLMPQMKEPIEAWWAAIARLREKPEYRVR